MGKRPRPFWVAHLCIGLVFSLLFVMSIIPGHLVVIVVWLVTIRIMTHRQHSLHGSAIKLPASLIHLLVLLVTIVAAHLAPGKAIDSYLKTQVDLPKSSMTLGELQAATERFGRDVFPHGFHVYASDDQKNVTIRFNTNCTTLADVVSAVERQSSLRLRTSSCGNAWTILWGKDVFFSVSLSTPRRGFH